MNVILVFLLALPCLGFADLIQNCTGRPNGPYNTGCEAFMLCHDGVGVLHLCQFGTAFSSKTNDCQPIAKVEAPCGDVKDCSNLPDGRYADINKGCHSYYTCNLHVYFGHNFCVSGLVFHEKIGVCDWPFNVYPPCGTKKHN